MSMEPSPLCTTDDVVTLFRALSDDETTLATRLIRMASARLRNQVLNLDARIASGDLDVNTVTDVCASMVSRVMRNPEGVTQETVGPMSATFSPQVAPGFFTILPDEYELLVPTRAVRPTVGTIPLVPGLERRERFRRRPL
jgi:hypothetical protein